MVMSEVKPVDIQRTHTVELEKYICRPPSTPWEGWRGFPVQGSRGMSVRQGMARWSLLMIILRSLTHSLVRYSPEQTQEPMTTLDLHHCLDVFPRGSNSGRRFEFTLAMRRQEIHLGAASEEEMHHWIQLIRSVLNRVSLHEAEHWDQQRDQLQEKHQQLESMNDQLRSENDHLRQTVEEMQEKWHAQLQQCETMKQQASQVECDTMEQVMAMQSQLGRLQSQNEQLEMEAQRLQGELEEQAVAAIVNPTETVAPELSRELYQMQSKLDSLQQSILDQSSGVAVEKQMSAMQSKLDAYQGHLEGLIVETQKAASQSKANHSSQGDAATIMSKEALKTLTQVDVKCTKLTSNTDGLRDNVQEVHQVAQASRHDIRTVLEGLTHLRDLVGKGSGAAAIKKQESSLIQKRIAELETAISDKNNSVPTNSLNSIGDSLNSLSAFLEKNLGIQNRSEEALQRKVDQAIASKEDKTSSKTVLAMLEDIQVSLAAIEKQRGNLTEAVAQVSVPTVDLKPILSRCDQIQADMKQLGKRVSETKQDTVQESTIQRLELQVEETNKQLSTLVPMVKDHVEGIYPRCFRALTPHRDGWCSRV